ncbi:WD40 repeat-containing protein [Artemisia annua]|uniref:WD40 repeat-containing protein n=1 Tax=Artemisia annua TaxID=35608 RepID=A0A2U1NA23_ARTAN|nr:WD40 repeat-containing protein [Artemisia annua]
MKKRMAAGRNASLDPRFDKKTPTLDEASCFIAIIVHSISIIDFIDLDLLSLPLRFTNFTAQSVRSVMISCFLLGGTGHKSRAWNYFLALLWDWETGSVKLAFDSGHDSNVYQAKIVPETHQRSIVTCAADGQVRHATILECGNVETELLSRHGGRAHKLANEANSPHIFYSCGEAGLVQHLDLRTGEPMQLFTCQPVRAFSYMSVVHLNDIAIDPRNPNLCLVGLAFSEHSELLVSYAEEFIYCFSKDMGWGNGVTTILADHLTVDSDVEMETDSKPGSQLFKGHRNYVAVKGVSLFGPKCEYVPSGSDCGRMFIWRKKDAKLVRRIEADKEVVNCIEAHPDIPILASSEKMRHKTGSWMHCMLSPRDMTLQLPARLNQQTNPERVVSNGLEFILTFDQRACVPMVPHVSFVRAKSNPFELNYVKLGPSILEEHLARVRGLKDELGLVRLSLGVDIFSNLKDRDTKLKPLELSDCEPS